MKNVVVATTTASGAAVSSSRITAVQSVYIAAEGGALPSSQSTPGAPLPMLSAFRCRLALAAALALALPLAPVAGRAGVRFENCQPTADGGISCDTRPDGDTLLDDEAARFGLFNEASPGWAEYSPYGWDDDI